MMRLIALSEVAKNYKSIYSALAANVLIAVTKFIAGAFTNSSSMLSEGIHSSVDSMNQILLLYGLKRGRKPPNHTHPFGYGKELYFWSFIVSILIFSLGGGLSIYQGYLHIRHPEKLESPLWNYIVLGLSVIFEGTSLIIAGKEFNKTRGGISWWKAIIRSKDPTSFLVLFEDGAAVLGLLIVGVFMFFNHTFNLPVLDGIASVCVGSLLVFVSLILARESRSLLMGEGIMSETRVKIRELAEQDSAVESVTGIISTYQSPEEVLLIMTIDFKSELRSHEIVSSIERLKEQIKNEFKLVKFVIIEPFSSKTAQPF